MKPRAVQPQEDRYEERLALEKNTKFETLLHLNNTSSTLAPYTLVLRAPSTSHNSDKKKKKKKKREKKKKKKRKIMSRTGRCKLQDKTLKE